MGDTLDFLSVFPPSSLHHYTASFPSSSTLNIHRRFNNAQNNKKVKVNINTRRLIVSMVQETPPQGVGASAIYAKEMENLSAKESLLLAGLGGGGGGGGGAHNLPSDVAQVIDQLELHCLAPDGSLISKSTFYDLQQAREEMTKERQRYLESLAVYIEAMSMVEEFQQSVSLANLGGIRDIQGLGLKASPQVYETLEHRLMVSEAAQRLRLPLISKDGDIHEEDIEKWSMMSRTSLDSNSTGFTIASSSNSTNYSNLSLIGAGSSSFPPSIDASEPEIGGVPNRYLGLVPAYLWQVQLRQTPFSMDMSDYQIMVSREIGNRLDAKCNKVADAIAIDEIDSSTANQTSIARLPERYAVEWVSFTEKNPGRRLVMCVDRVGGCRFWEWIDEPVYSLVKYVMR